MWTLLIELKKDHGEFKAGDRIRATREELKTAGLKADQDYTTLGGGPAHSDLSPPEDVKSSKAAQATTPKKKVSK